MGTDLVSTIGGSGCGATLPRMSGCGRIFHSSGTSYIISHKRVSVPIITYWPTAAHNFPYTSANEPRRSIRIAVRVRLVTMKRAKSF
jgi:hypothetical protein